MSHPFGDRVSQHLHRKHGLSQAKLAEGILQDPSIIGKMCKGERLHGVQARERVCAIIDWLYQQMVLTTVDEANGLLNAAGMAPLRSDDVSEGRLLQQLRPQAPAPTLPATPRSPVLATPRTNLPTPLTTFIGRATAVVEVAQLVVNHRLVTLTGAGGVGKTRLALETAKTFVEGLSPMAVPFPDGLWFADLAPLTNPEAIPQRILDLWRVPEQSASTPLATLIAYLRTKQTLLILDNCEHLIGACAALAETLLQACPQLSLLATSREALNIGGELPWRVPSLTRPRTESGWAERATGVQPPLTREALSRFEAVTLFVERAGVRQPGFALTTANAPAVAQICSRLDGIPLALEMAAARVNIFTVEELARRLDGAFDGRFQLLTNGTRTAPLRHQTLRATLEWSYALLPAVEKRLLTRLSVFSGGWTLAAAEEVAGATLDRLAQLVSKSLVIADQQGGQSRYRLLETVRQFGAEQALADEQTQRQVQQQHSRYYLHLLGAQEERLHQEAMTIYATLGLQFGVATCKADLSLALADAGRVAEAITQAQEAVAIMRALNNQMMLTVSLGYLGAVYLAAEEFTAAHDALVEVIQRAWKHRYLAQLMNAFYYVAEWLVAEKRTVDASSELKGKALAVTVLSFVRPQTETWQFFKDKAEKLQAQIEEALPADVRATAIARGQTATLEAMVDAVLEVAGTGQS